MIRDCDCHVFDAACVHRSIVDSNLNLFTFSYKLVVFYATGFVHSGCGHAAYTWFNPLDFRCMLCSLFSTAIAVSLFLFHFNVIWFGL